MNTRYEHYEEKNGITFLYNFTEKYGWSVELPNNLTREQMRCYICNSNKYWPETPEEYKEGVQKNMEEMINYIRNYRVDNEA